MSIFKKLRSLVMPKKKKYIAVLKWHHTGRIMLLDLGWESEWMAKNEANGIRARGGYGGIDIYKVPSGMRVDDVSHLEGLQPLNQHGQV